MELDDKFIIEPKIEIEQMSVPEEKIVGEIVEINNSGENK